MSITSKLLLAIGSPAATGEEKTVVFAMARSTPTRTLVPMGNYVIRVGNYVIAKAPSLGNSVIVDTHCLERRTSAEESYLCLRELTAADVPRRRLTDGIGHHVVANAPAYAIRLRTQTGTAPG